MNSNTSIHPAGFDIFTARKILVANDFSPLSCIALSTAVRIAGSTGAELIVLHVEESFPLVPWGTPACEYLKEQETHHSVTRNRLKKILAEYLLELVHGAPPPVQIIAVDGDPATEIVKIAFDFEVDLILIASHGRTGLSRVLMGSTAEKVVRHAACPVMVVRDKKDVLDLPPVQVGRQAAGSPHAVLFGKPD